MNERLETLCGQLIVAGFEGTFLPPTVAAALANGHRAGIIVFKRNLQSLEQVHALCQAVIQLSPSALVAVDQEGGRVQRIGPPLLQLPAMRHFGEHDAIDLANAAARQLGRQLAALGFNVDFAPVLDVDSNPQNPVIGDRAFGRSPEVVERFGRTFAEGLEQSGVLACGKHFPGHGDTDQDSHFALPVVSHSRQRLEAVELAPFRALSSSVSAMMTAHVVYSAFDAERPATVLHQIATDLLRNDLGFQGLLFSDDLEMRAVAERFSIEELAVAAIRAGCDVLLICRSAELQQRAHLALIAQCQRDRAFLERCAEAAARCRAARQRFPSKPLASFDSLVALLQHPSAGALQQQLDALATQ